MPPILLILSLPLGIQAAAILADEFHFHRRREIPLWERIGHPLDTAGFLLPLLLAILTPFTPGTARIFAALAALSCVLIVKDEFVHARLCSPSEHLCHAFLFIIHPLALLSIALLWRRGAPEAAWILRSEAGLAAAFGLFQALYWNLIVPPPAAEKIDNEFYDELGEGWYERRDHPVALLRAEARLRNPWVAEEIARRLGPGPKEVLDLGCGAGLLANPLAAAGHRVTGLDLSASSLAAARRRDKTGSVRYEEGSALSPPYPDGSFDAVCAMDFLEHVEDPEAVVARASRLLRPGGLFFAYTINRNPVSWLIALKGIEWFVRNAPPRMHVYRLLIKPRELAAMGARQELSLLWVRGSRPRIGRAAFWRLLKTGAAPEDFEFAWSRSKTIGYLALFGKPLPSPRRGEG